MNIVFTDFAVGAHSSGHAVIIRSRPVVTLTAALHPIVEADGLPRNSTKLQVMACIKYSGSRLSDTLSEYFIFRI